jgi:hypothetical protein
MLRPMIPLAIGIAILDEHTRLARLETNASSCHAAAIGTAVGRCIKLLMIHYDDRHRPEPEQDLPYDGQTPHKSHC